MAVYLGEDRIGTNNYFKPGPTVKFIDYDGTILYEYPVIDFLTFTSMPPNPTHTGLTSQGWNWTLADAKAQLIAMPNSGLIIGQQYITSDGATRLYCTFNEITRTLVLAIILNGTAVINWGDGSSQTLTGTSSSVTSTTHTYAASGDYVISISPSNDSSTVKFTFWDDDDEESYSAILNCTTVGSTEYYDNHTAWLASIKKIEFGKNVMFSGYSFAYCRNLKSVTMPNTVSGTFVGLFYECSNLQCFIYPAATVTSNAAMFDYCSSLTTVSIPKLATIIDSSMFYECRSLKNIVLHKDITKFNSSAFGYAMSLDVKELPPSLTKIDNSAFTESHNLKSVEIPASCTTVGAGAFKNCPSLSSVEFLGYNTTLSGTYTFSGCSNLESIDARYVILSGTYTFNACEGLISIKLSAVPNNICYSCRSLSSVELIEGITTIGQSAFWGCESLSSIVIPSTVTTISTGSFADCRCLGAFHVRATTPPTLATNVFTNAPSYFKIYVPSASLATYKAATNWSAFASKIYGE